MFCLPPVSGVPPRAHISTQQLVTQQPSRSPSLCATATSPRGELPATSASSAHQSQFTGSAEHRLLRGSSLAAGPSGRCLPPARVNDDDRARSTPYCSSAAATATTAAAASLLLIVTPLGPLAGPAAARIPTETVLSDSGGGGAAAAPSGRSALMQLAVPPSAVLAPNGAGLEAGAEAGAEAGPGPGSKATRGSVSGTGRGVAPGTMVGTPNYARGPIAGPGPRSTASEAAAALQLLSSAREAVDGGQHDQALELYGRLVSEHSDLALAEYGRIGRAMMLYQVGRTSDSILALEDEEVVMRGAAEVHAALAALLYSERPSLALRAEEEWNLACLFDKRYSDPEWVRANKHWPPRMIAALQRFLSLS